ncbi:NADH/ubiquinone/plastoquinone (complex I) [Aquisalimonas sp. 2447]|uniref:complex I subunit 5 family protein n=1 Tax=Aquisalimonas sp. 2447 TaxID=2740807 RepID=UPI001432804F|nr:proton-conducting transporter membrane subunit [Aquisalimonas sp. 2447]QIT54962.1 NADH/ubiquinone/plastoquinone (complex I) [Aquisalimonas sp. 2447]
MTLVEWAAVLLACVPVAAAIGAFCRTALGPVLAITSGAALIGAGAALAVAVASHGVVHHDLGGWGAPVGITWTVDGLAAAMLLLTAIVGTAGSIHHAVQMPRDGHFWSLWLFLWAGLNVLFLSADLFNLYVALELLTLAAVALIALTGGQALGAAWRYLLAMLLGSSLYLFGVALLYGRYGVLDLHLLADMLVLDHATGVAVTLATVGLLLKAGAFPLHFWLPKAHGRAPAAVSAILSAVVVTASYYLLVRLWFGPFSVYLHAWPGQALGLLGALAIIWGGLQALAQRHLKLLIAYSTVSQLGFGLLLFPLAAGAAPELAWQGALVLIVAHSLAKAALFLAAGCIIQFHGHDRIPALGGSQRGLMLVWLAMALASASLIGLPPSSGFSGKLWLLQAALQDGAWWWAGVMVGGTLLTAGYLFRIFDVAADPAANPNKGGPALPRLLPWSAVALAVSAVLLGLAAPQLAALLNVGGVSVP